jgi:hypothetical protein
LPSPGELERFRIPAGRVGGTKAMKAREPRHKVLVRARMYAGGGWHDTCILNVSSRGLLLQAAAPPVKGTYLEIRRGPVTIMARVMWTKSHRFGVKTQDLVRLEAITPEAPTPTPGQVDRRNDRRSKPGARLSEHDSSRQRGRLIEYGFAAALAAAGAGMVASEVAAVLGAPIRNVEAALASGAPD